MKRLLCLAGLILCLMPAARAQQDITMLFVGDILLAEGPGRLLRAGKDPFVHVAPLFRAADIRIGNLECTISHRGSANDKPFTFRAHPRSIPVLKKYFSAVSLANNHSGDFGPEAFADMLGLLEKAGMPSFGGGRNIRAAHQPHIVELKGKRIAILGYDGFIPRSFEALEDRPGVAWLDEDFIAEDIRHAREDLRADLVITYPHWGWENEKLAWKSQRHLARVMIDAGADAVVGGHPHVTQDIELYRGKPIFYSLGNFVFDVFDNAENTSAWALFLTLKGDGRLDWKIQPVKIDARGVPRPVGPLLERPVS